MKHKNPNQFQYNPSNNNNNNSNNYSNSLNKVFKGFPICKIDNNSRPRRHFNHNVKDIKPNKHKIIIIIII